MPSRSLQDTNTSDRTPVPSQPATDVSYSEAQSTKFLEADASDVIKNSISIQDSRQLDQAKIGSPFREESENGLAVVKSVQTNLPSDVSEDREQLCDLACSVAPSVSTCLSNIESSKPLIDVATENLVESQSSSTPNCLALAGAETDGRCKELEWLEELDRALQDKKNRDTCSFEEQDGITVQASTARASLTVPKSLVRSELDQVSHITLSFAFGILYSVLMGPDPGTIYWKYLGWRFKSQFHSPNFIF